VRRVELTGAIWSRRFDDGIVHGRSHKDMLLSYIHRIFGTSVTLSQVISIITV